MRKIFLYLLIGIVLGIIPSIWIVQNNRKIKQLALESIVTHLEKEWNASIKIASSSINLFLGRIVVNGLTITLNDDVGCMWESEKCVIQILKSSLFSSRLDLAISFVNNDVTTGYQGGQIGLLHLLEAIFTHKPQLFCAKSFTIKNAKVATKDMTDDGLDPCIEIEGVLLLLRDKNSLWHGRFAAQDALLSVRDDVYISSLRGITEFHQQEKVTMSSSNGKESIELEKYMETICQHTILSPLLFEKQSAGECSPLYFVGKWNQQEKLLTLKNDDETLFVALTALDDEMKLSANVTLNEENNVTLEMWQKVFPNFEKSPTGSVTATFHFPSTGAKKNYGKVVAKNVCCNEMPIKKIVADLVQNDKNVRAEFSIKHDFVTCGGIGGWNLETKKGFVRIENSEKFCVNDLLYVDRGDLVGEVSIDGSQKNISCEGKYALTLTHSQTKEAIKTHGTASFLRPTLRISGTSSYGTYACLFDTDSRTPSCNTFFNSLRELVITKKAKEVARVMKGTGDVACVGTFHYSFLQSLLPISFRQWLLGNKGDVTVEIMRADQKKIVGDIRFEDGKIHIPGNYNLITDASSSFVYDVATKKCILSDSIINFYKGSLKSNRLVLQLDTLTDEFNPLVFGDFQANNVMLNWRRDFFGIINGNLLVTCGEGAPMAVQGDIVIKKSLIRENLFFHGASVDAMAGGVAGIGFFGLKKPVNLDVRIANEQDLEVMTPFLSTQATSDLHLVSDASKGCFSPYVTGSITLRRGTLSFPRNKLFITSGKIDFIPHQPGNPMVTLLAKNRIKKYMITLQVAGQMEKPTVFLESNPELSEEQIIALLFAGSENISLQANLPTLIMQNLSTLILGKKDLQPVATGFFQRIAKSFKYVQITPHFSDQSGRGGVKGTIDVDLNKQLHARIQKNFTMQDDLSFLLEYFFADNLNVKAIKDHRGDIGGEVEFVLKP